MITLVELQESYIVYLGSHSHGPNPSSADLDSATNSHYDFLASILGSHEKAKEAMFYSYNKHINGFAALLEDEEAEEIKKKPNVVSVFLSKMHKLHTTRSWEFLGLEKNGRIGRDSAWKIGNYGRNTIIGNIDTGYEAHIGKIPSSERSARDIVGHGSHTLSTAGGNFVRRVSVLNNGNGTAKGGSPRARVAAYKACWSSTDAGGCYDSDLLDAFDHAISDGVDVLSVSIGGNQHFPEDLLTDGISIGAFHAVAKGIVVVCSAGNEGPDPGTVKNVAPWVFTVAASSIDRDFNNNITLGNGQSIKGTSLATGLPSQNFFSIIRAADAKLSNATVEDAQLCNAGTLDPNKVRGKILICQRGRSLRPLDKGQQALLAGAVGMFLESDAKDGDTVTADPHVLATSGSTNKTSGWAGNDYYNTTNNPIAFMDKAKTFLGIKPAPVMASFSSRGPNVIQPKLLKPDVTAPGLNIIAAYTLGASPSNIPSDTRRFPFNVLSGTSMACPHVAGIAGLLKTRYPTWSPAAIKSAIMTTATILDNNNNLIQDGVDEEPATPFAYGSGHVRPDLAIDPGLVYDLKPSDYLDFLCGSGYEETLVASFNHEKHYKCPKSYRIEDFNYPTITVSNPGATPITVTRTVTNVGPPSTYSVNVIAPIGVNVVVQPKVLKFSKTLQKKTFRVVLKTMGLSQSGNTTFGELSWTDGKHRVRSPIVVLQSET
ncbi:subtilisin-like protease [Senna tora]|uniref:Subtilisin-like protease n=1 Tax=Senna tora TaxID=362788 RepID=A0A834T3K2_9FABA|nr:subtilisin-like protease [Senna tora]